MAIDTSNQLTVFSLDFDGHGSGLNPEALLGKRLKSDQAYTKNTYYLGGLRYPTGQHYQSANFTPRFVHNVHTIREHYHGFLQQFVKPKIATELYVGSNRQSAPLDSDNAIRTGRGSCFKFYKHYAKRQGWLFRPLLMADIDNGKPAGTAMKAALSKEETRRHLEVTTSWDRKDKMVLAQLRDIKKNHPGKAIHYIFGDDHKRYFPGIIRALEDAYKNPTLCGALPSQLQLTLVHFEVPASSSLKVREYSTEGAQSWHAKIAHELTFEHTLDKVSSTATATRQLSVSMIATVTSTKPRAHELPKVEPDRVKELSPCSSASKPPTEPPMIVSAMSPQRPAPVRRSPRHAVYDDRLTRFSNVSGTKRRDASRPVPKITPVHSGDYGVLFPPIRRVHSGRVPVEEHPLSKPKDKASSRKAECGCLSLFRRG